jgi:hypothetical protein
LPPPRRLPPPTPSQSFASEKELEELAAAWPAERLVAVWNSLLGVKPVKGFKSNNAAASRIWERIQRLGEAAQPEAEPAKPKAERKAKGGAKVVKGAPAKGKATKKATPAKNAPKANRAAKAQEAAGPRCFCQPILSMISDTLLHSCAGASQPPWAVLLPSRTVRGFMADAMKKAGYEVESFKPEGGVRTYRINTK